MPISTGEMFTSKKAILTLPSKTIAKRLSAKAYRARGGIYYRKGDFDAAIADCSKAIEIDPTNIEAYHNRGAAYDKLGEREKARQDVKKANELYQ